MEHQSLITIVPWTFIFQILNLLLTAFLFKKFLFQPVKKILQKRQDEVNSLYTDAETAKTQALAAQNDYEAKLTNAHTQAEVILSDAKDAARTQSDAMLSAAREEVAALKTKAAADLELEKKKAVNAMKDRLADLAVEIAGKVTEQALDSEKHGQLIDSFIEKLGDEQ